MPLEFTQEDCLVPAGLSLSRRKFVLKNELKISTAESNVSDSTTSFFLRKIS